jgi:hypothetical protein
VLATNTTYDDSGIPILPKTLLRVADFTKLIETYRGGANGLPMFKKRQMLWTDVGNEKVVILFVTVRQKILK